MPSKRRETDAKPARQFAIQLSETTPAESAVYDLVRALEGSTIAQYRVLVRSLAVHVRLLAAADRVPDDARASSLDLSKSALEFLKNNPEQKR